MKYDIAISEYQRAILEIAMRHLSFEAVNEIKRLTIPNFENDQMSAAGVLRDMIIELPQDEADHPGTLHGFAL